MPNFSLANKTALVTGAARGIGQAIAVGLAEHGASLVLWDLEYSALEETAHQVCALGPECRCFQVDIADWDAVQKAVDTTDFWGIDVCVNNAGVVAKPTPFETMTAEEWHRVMEVNLDGTAAVCRSVGMQMKRMGQHGSIINIGSMSGLVANKGFYNSVYNASKAGILQLTRSLACEWARYGIRVNSIAPGPIQTPMSDGLKERDPALYKEFGGRTAIGRWGLPSEVVGAVVYLASDASSFVTGSALVCDGGYTAW